MPEEVKVPDEKNKKGPNFLIIIIVVVLLTLVIAAGTSFLILNFLGPNLGQSSGNVGTAKIGRASCRERVSVCV